MGVTEPSAIVRARPMTPRAFEVRSNRRETRDTRTLELEPLDGDLSPRFDPGQFNMLYAFGAGESAISISGDPARAGRLVHTVRGVGPVSRALCAARAGAVVGVRGPFGSHWPVEESRGSDIVVAAGGIGLAPLRPALYSVLARRRRYGEVTLLYGARTMQELLYRKELHEWRGRFDMNVEVTVDRADEETTARVGVVTTLIPLAHFDPLDTVAFVCGPEVMMRFTVLELLARGVPAEQIYVSMERNMKCAVGLCGHCQLGPKFVCKDGAVFRWSDIAGIFSVREM
jgi:NAD(P)H-flavin reductase